MGAVEGDVGGLDAGIGGEVGGGVGESRVAF